MNRLLHATGLSLGLLLLSSAPAFAQDDDDFEFEFDEEEEDAEEAPKRTSDQEQLQLDDPEDDDEWAVEPNEEGDEELDFDEEDFEEDAEVQTRGPGEDTAQLYRDQLEKAERLSPDEEALAWEKYLKKYPNSIFRDRIDSRLQELSEEMYGEYIEDQVSRAQDAGKAEINFAPPFHLENIDPRTRIRGGIEWGFPNYFTFQADYEQQLMRELSVHGGVKGRYRGTNIEAGVRYALVKSARMNLLVTGIFDVHYNINPAHPGFRPIVAAGKRFSFGEVDLDVQLQGGSDMLLLTGTNGTVFSPHIIGGANITVAPAPIIRIFAETSTYMKGFGNEQVGSFRFNQISFGLRFVKRKTQSKDLFEAGGAANVPYTRNYWGYHYGSVAADGIFYL